MVRHFATSIFFHHHLPEDTPNSLTFFPRCIVCVFFPWCIFFHVSRKQHTLTYTTRFVPLFCLLSSVLYRVSFFYPLAISCVREVRCCLFHICDDPSASSHHSSTLEVDTPWLTWISECVILSSQSRGVLGWFVEQPHTAVEASWSSSFSLLIWRNPSQAEMTKSQLFLVAVTSCLLSICRTA